MASRRGIGAFRGALAELWATVTVNFRGADAWVEIASSPLWVLGLALAILSQNPASLGDPVVLGNVCWSIVVFVMISDKLWIVGHKLDREKRAGILENVLASRASIALHSLTPSIAAMMWTLASTVITLAVVFPVLGASPVPADPLLLAIGYALSDLTASGIALLYAPAVIALRRPWIATSFLQFTLPLISGIIPPTYLPPGVREAIAYNPLSYPVEILRRGATGTAYMEIPAQMAILISIAGMAVLYTAGVALVAAVIRLARRRGL